jgi:MYXO-CTERM domain-containing protein
MISFAGAGPNTRGSDVFITFMTGTANGTPRAPWETPFGIIDEEGLRAVTSFYPEYGDFKSFGGNAPELGRKYESYKESHPLIDYLGECTLVYPQPVTTSRAAVVHSSAPPSVAPTSIKAGGHRAAAAPGESVGGTPSSGWRNGALVVLGVFGLLLLRRMAGYRRPLYRSFL